MTRERKDDPPWHGHWLALVPYRFQDAEPTCGRSILVDLADKDERRTFYEALLELKRLSPKVRLAVMKELGRSQRAQTVKNAEAVTVMLEVMIAKREAQIRKNGKRPQGSVSAHEEAVADVADAQGVDAETLKKRLVRHRRRSRK